MVDGAIWTRVAIVAERHLRLIGIATHIVTAHAIQMIVIIVNTVNIVMDIVKTVIDLEIDLVMIMTDEIVTIVEIAKSVDILLLEDATTTMIISHLDGVPLPPLRYLK